MAVTDHRGRELGAPSTGPGAPDDGEGTGSPDSPVERLDAARRASHRPADHHGDHHGGASARDRLRAVVGAVGARARRTPGRELAAGIALSLLGLGLLLGWVVEVSWTPLVDLALVVIGLLLVVQSRLATPSRPLMALGVVLALVAAGTWRADTDLDGGVGRRTVAPPAATAGVIVERLGTGQLTVDLRATDLGGAPFRLRAEVGVGRIVVLVPEDVAVAVEATVGGGQARLLDRRHVGPGLEEPHLAPGAGGEVVRLDLRVGLGSVEVDRG